MNLEDIKQKISHLAQKHSSIPENDLSDFGNAEILESEAFHLIVDYSESQGYLINGFPTEIRNRYENDETYKIQTYNFGGGMILVSLLDAESSRLIWRGYASGVFNKQVNKPVNYYRSVVRSIFDQYPLFAAGEKPRKVTEM